MYKKILVFAILILPFIASSQHFEVGVLAGGSNYMGDLSFNSTKIYMEETHFTGGIFARYNLNRFFAIKLGGNFAKVSGTDAHATDQKVTYRNLSFESKIMEGSLIFDINFPGFEPYNYEQVLSPYIFGGIAIFHFEPTTVFQKRTVGLQPLGTEGQGLSGFPGKYNLTEFAIPFGLGVKYALTESWSIGLEVGARFLFTDYLDDVSKNYVAFDDLLAGNGSDAASLGNRTGELLGTEPISVPTGTQRGDDKNNDWYGIFGLTFSYHFMDNGLSRGRGRRKGGDGCPNAF